MEDGGPERRADRAAEVGSLYRGAPELSSRRRTARREWTYRALAPLGSGLLRSLWATYRTRVVGLEPWRARIDAGPVIPCFWHARTVACASFLNRLTREGLEPSLLVSPSVDGDLTEKVARRFGFHVLRGSATRTGTRSIRDLHREIVREQRSPVVIPDGPQGPALEAKPGALMLSQLAQVPILPISFAASRAFHVATWDRWIVPYPFARVVFAVGDPIQVEREADAAGLERAREQLETALAELERTAGAELRTP